MEFCKEWTAYHDRMPGKEPALRVFGTCCMPTGGWSTDLGPHEGPPGINPRVLMLDLLVAAPTGPASDVVTEILVQYEVQTPSQYDQVHVRATGDAHGDKVIDVEETS
jgi:hypothetical protein